MNKSLACDFRNESIGFVLATSAIEECIAQKSNNPFWNNSYYSNIHDLRNPINKEIKDDIFRSFGLDPNKTYLENLKENGCS